MQFLSVCPKKYGRFYSKYGGFSPGAFKKLFIFDRQQTG